MENYLKGKALIGFRKFPDELERLWALFAYTDGGRFLSWCLSFEDELGFLYFVCYILLSEFLF